MGWLTGFSKPQVTDNDRLIDALNRALAIIEFEPNGTIVNANDNFLEVVGYSLHEITGQHHSLFVDTHLQASPEYKSFWQRLGRGETMADEFPRVAKDGSRIWLQATYNPILDAQGKVYKVVKVATDITEQKKREQSARKTANLARVLVDCQANIMLADNELKIVFVNKQVVNMLNARESKIQQVLPNFKVADLVGTCVDVFHKEPSHQRQMLAALNKPYQTTLKLAGLTFSLIATPWLSAEGERLGTLVEWQDMTDQLAKQEQELKESQANARVKQALDNVTTCAMVADQDNNIIYMNEAVAEMLRLAESDLRKDLPHFKANEVLGKNVDVFHKNPAHQQAMLARLSSTYRTEIKVGGRTFALTANPITDDSGARLGTVVEWKDRTAEVAIEHEVEGLIQAVQNGDLSQRVNTQGKEGFFLNLSQGLNQIIDISEGVISNTVDVLDALAHGDLTKRIHANYQGMFDKLKRDANATAEKLTDVIGRIEEAANTVASGAEEIAQGNTDLSQRTEEQASSLEQTASSMEQMTATVRQNADNARTANQLSGEAEQKATSGGAIVSRAVEGMAEINQSSKKIADIIGVIDEIAFQTNLLALNAAVEAARAGEQGRGFAVVAGEVRNLAQRSAAAAKEIKDLIRDSVSKVEDGTALVNQSGEVLKDIVEAVRKVNQTITEITVASEEQSSGIEQVNKAVSQMDEMTQQNAALVEEASAAGESMSEQARAMKQLLSFFKLSDTARIEPMRAEPIRTAPSEAKRVAGPKKAKDVDEEWQEF